MCRSKESAEKISSSASKIFNKILADEALPTINILNPEISFINALKSLNFLKTNGEARRLIRGNGAKINDIVVSDEDYILKVDDFKNGKVKISSGKKRHGLLICS